MQLGVYGGSFDPIHLGHLLLAECCREQHSLDRVLFVPAHQSPHKLDADPVPADTRCEMVQLAIAGHEPFELCREEVDRGGVSFTVDTLQSLSAQHPDARLFLLMGADALADFPSWKHPQQICELCDLVVVNRPGGAPVDFQPLAGFMDAPRLKQLANLVVEMPQIDLSSSDIRARVREGRSIRFQTPRAVELLIRTQQLYQHPS